MMTLQDKIIEILNADDWEALEDLMFDNDVSIVESDIDWLFFETAIGDLLGFCNYSHDKMEPDWNAVEDPEEYVGDGYVKNASVGMRTMVMREIERFRDALDELA